MEQPFIAVFKYVAVIGSFWRALLNEKNMIFKQNKKNIHIFILFKSFHALALNACFFLLELIVGFYFKLLYSFFFIIFSFFIFR